MRVLLVFMLVVSTVTRAQDPLPADAPIMYELNPDYVCIPKDQRHFEGKSAKRCIDRNESLTKGNVILPTASFIAIVGGSAAVAAIVTGLVIGFTKK